MLRAAALALLVLISVAVMLPLVDSSAHNSGRSTVSRRHYMGRRHSRAWWRRYRARQRRQRAALKRKGALQAMRGQSLNAAAESHNNVVEPIKLAVVASTASNNPVNALSLPNGWVRRVAAGGESKFVVSAPDGQFIGAATLSLINANASGETLMNTRANRRTLGGVPLAQLRRTVIDKMIASNGWVVNDLQREIGGKPVFIVLAQTAASGDGRTPQLSWAFYFTEVDGRIYSLAASSLLEFSNRLSDEAAQFLASFNENSRSALTGSSQR